ncbi:MAG: hypothetical protein ACMUIA_10155 [bacterium]
MLDFFSAKNPSAAREEALEGVALVTHIEEISFESFLKSGLKKIDPELKP